MKIKFLRQITASLFLGLMASANAGIIISGDVTNGTGVFTITEDIVFNLTDGSATNPNADPYAILFHGWNNSFGGWSDGDGWAGGKNQFVGDKLDLRREPDPFSVNTNGIFASGWGANTVLSNELSSAPIFDGNFYNRGSVLWFSDTFQRVRQLGFDKQGAEGDGDRFVIGAGSWSIPKLAKWDLYGEFSGDATLYLALGYSENPPLSGSGRQIPIATASLTSVTEPSTVAMFALALIGIASRRFRR